MVHLTRGGRVDLRMRVLSNYHKGSNYVDVVLACAVLQTLYQYDQKTYAAIMYSSPLKGGCQLNLKITFFYENNTILRKPLHPPGWHYIGTTLMVVGPGGKTTCALG
jgi:hypothetical protein